MNKHTITYIRHSVNLYKVNVIMDNTNDPHDMYLDTTSNQGVIVGSDIKGKYLYNA